MLGIKDIVAKSLGTANPHNVIRACMKALTKQNSPKNISFMEVDRKIKSNYDSQSYSNSKLLVNIALDGSENIEVWKDT